MESTVPIQFMDLPDEILYKIFYYCPLLSIKYLMQCNKYLHNLIKFTQFVKLNTLYYKNKKECKAYKYIEILDGYDKSYKIKHRKYKHYDKYGVSPILYDYNYCYGLKHGICKRTQEDTVNEYNYVNNTKHGICRQFYKGMLVKEATYINGNKHGLYTSYYHAPGAPLCSQMTYYSNRAKYNDYYNKPYKCGLEFVSEEIMYVNGIKHGYSRKYNYNGTLQFDCYYVNNLIHGIHKRYYNDGTVSDEATYICGVLHGLYLRYYKGNLSQLSSSSIYISGKQLKPVAYYDIDGNIIGKYFDKN